MTTDAPPVEAGHRTRPPRGGLLWGTVWTLAPYLVIALFMIIDAWRQGDDGHCQVMMCLAPVDGVLLMLTLSAPFAVLGTGVAWLVVLLMDASRLRRWPALLRGALAGGFVWLAAITAIAWALT